MTREQRVHIENIVDLIDSKRRELEEEYKETPHRHSKKYRQVDQHYLDTLRERRNTLVSVLNFDYTGDIKYLEELL